ncbi:MAG: RidA family protein [Alphaproteobacteria bacterium]
MTGTIDSRLAELGIELPEATAPVANYVPYALSGNTVYISGQVPILGGEFKYTGKLGGDVSIDDGYQAARLCALNVIAQVKAACGGNLDRVVRCLKLGGFVNSTPDFGDQPKIINGASDLMVEVFEDKGRHARFAVSAASLPFNVAVEVDAVFEIA